MCRQTHNVVEILDESLLGRSLQVHVELNARRLKLVSTRTVRATSGAALLHAHHEYGEEDDEQAEHDDEQRPHDQMVHILARLGFHALINLHEIRKKLNNQKKHINIKKIAEKRAASTSSQLIASHSHLSGSHVWLPKQAFCRHSA